MTHYETLNVPPGADADEIRKAYRAASSKAHPDREGGSTEAMQAVNRAFEVLCDPERRARYDAGEDDQAADVPGKMLREAMQHFIEGANAIDKTREALVEALETLAESAVNTSARIKKLEIRKSKIVCKGSNTLPHQMLDERINALHARRTGEATTIAHLKKALELLREYEDVPEEPAVNIAQGRNRTMGRFYDENVFGVDLNRVRAAAKAKY